MDASPAAEPGPVRFNRDVLPILSDKCFQCHGPDSASRKGDLRLDREAEAKLPRDGYAIIAPGKPDESELVHRIHTTEADDRMPPPEEVKQLTPAEAEILTTWIAQGAPWEVHWAFQPVHRPEIPDAGAAGGDLHPIDAFIRQRLAEEGLHPAAPADPATLLRRVALDLTGLPPTPAEVAAFLAAPDRKAAYAAAVDRLLDSPRFGERMTWDWLEAARYADTHGYQKDNVRTMWAWRDWVIDAYNRNLPFDQFTIEQLAGDLLPNPSTAQLVATGFNRNHRINAEAGSIDEEFRVEYVIDRVDTTATIWLGLTAGCARCHDHKFDPLSQKEYYALYAFFNNIQEKGSDGVQPVAAPSIEVSVPGYEKSLRQARAALQNADKQLSKDAAALDSAFQDWKAKIATLVASGNFWTVLSSPKVTGTSSGSTFTPLPDGSVLFGGANPLNDVHAVEVNFPASARVSAIRLEALPDASLTDGSLARSFDGNFLLSGFEAETKAGPVSFSHAEADFSQPGHDIRQTIDGNPLTGWAVDVAQHPGETRTAWFSLKEPLEMAAGETLTLRLRYESREEQFIIGRFRLSMMAGSGPVASFAAGSRDLSEVPLEIAGALSIPDKATKQDAELVLRDYFHEHAPELTAARQRRDAARDRLSQLEEAATTQVMVMSEMSGKPRETHVLNRGQYDQPGETVAPGVPEALGLSLPEGEPHNRLGLAHWLVNPENPLTARVAVNRLWQMLFGVGLVKTPEDFGFQGARPSHPELLDWLAATYMDSGWDTKALLKQIVTSQTYQQSSAIDPALLARDPDNQLFARGPRYRLPAPMLRDQALFAAGLLKEELGGPPVKPYQPPGLWESVAGVNSNTIHYEPDHGGRLYRRTLYTFWKRSVPPPNLILFDAASRDACAVKRTTTNSPLQALVTLNDPTYAEAARVLAQTVLSASAKKAGPNESDDALVAALWQRTQARAPSPKETQILRNALNRERKRYAAHPALAAERIRIGEFPIGEDLDPVELAACTEVAALLLNLDSTLTKH